MKVKRLIYIANARLPTEKAHGYQICKMCEAFVQTGLDVLLLHSDRYQYDRLMYGKTVFDYYGIAPVFAVRSLANLDVVPLSSWMPEKLFSGLFFTHAILWGLYAALAASKETADLYYTRDSSIAFWLVKLGLPTVYEAHVVPKGGQRSLLNQFAQHSALQRVVVLTSFIKKEFLEMGFPAEKVIVRPDGVDLSLFADLPDKQECRKRLGLPPDRPIIGYIGRFRTMEMEKGIPQLIEAIANLPTFEDRDPLLLCVGGPMDAVPAYLKIAGDFQVPEHRLQFRDRVPNRDVPFWMRACDLVTIPWPRTEFSAYFTSPMKLFEYMASGVPIIASDLPSIREVLQHRQNAWLVEAGSGKALARGMTTLLADKQMRQLLAQTAWRDAIAYSWHHRSNSILQEVKDV